MYTGTVIHLQTIKRISNMTVGENYNPDGLIQSLPCCRKFHGKFSLKILVFSFIIFIDVADLISDWLLFKDITFTEKGLVYGPPEKSIRVALLAFCIIGTQSIALELINLWRDIFRGNPWLDVELLSSITVWLEDVPQIIINIIIIGCREEAISYFQLMKASVAVAGVIIRILFSLITFCNKRTLDDLGRIKEDHRSRIRFVYRFMIMSGLLITLGGAAIIFLFTQYERNPDGSLNFKVPHNYIEGKYDDEKYFKNVSVYLSHKMFDLDSSLSKSTKNRNLLRLLDVNDIRYGNGMDKIIKIELEQLNYTTDMSKFIIWESDNEQILHAKECFSSDRTEEKITLGLNCSSYLSNQSHYIMFLFRFIKPYDLKLIFGDIMYNIKVKYSSDKTCKPPDFKLRNDVNEISETAALHYYRNLNNLKETHIIHSSNNGEQFYNTKDLQDIKDVWKTGFVYCKSTGRLAPHRDSSITVPCL